MLGFLLTYKLRGTDHLNAASKQESVLWSDRSTALITNQSGLYLLYQVVSSSSGFVREKEVNRWVLPRTLCTYKIYVMCDAQG